MVTNVTTCFPSKKVWDTVRGQLEAGRPIGDDIIRRYNNSLAKREVDQATIQLKETGKLKEIIEQVRAADD